MPRSWASRRARPREAPRAIAIPLRLRRGDDELAFISMIATFGTALDITLDELSIETFLPADARNRRGPPPAGRKSPDVKCADDTDLTPGTI